MITNQAIFRYNNIVISGVGDTPYRANASESAEHLAVHAVLSAIEDAGLQVEDIDGVCSYVGHVSAETLISTLGIPSTRARWTIGGGGASAVSALAQAGTVVSTGRVRNVVIYRAIKGRSGPRKFERPLPLPAENLRRSLELVHGWSSAAQRYSMLCRRYMYEHGLTRTQLGAYSVLARDHAQRNKNAQMYGKPITIDDYLNSRMIADPYRLLDCCLESDGACAVIVSTAGHDGTRGVRLLAAAEGQPDTPDDMTNRPDFLGVGLDVAARRVWNELDIGPEDMDAAMIYDCFTFEVIHQLESAGFVPEGQAGPFLESGGGTLGSSLPINTHGGLMSEGHMAGLNHVVEAVRQIRGECRDRQIQGASRIAVTGWGNLSEGSLAVLSRH